MKIISFDCYTGIELTETLSTFKLAIVWEIFQLEIPKLSCTWSSFMFNLNREISFDWQKNLF